MIGLQEGNKYLASTVAKSSGGRMDILPWALQSSHLVGFSVIYDKRKINYIKANYCSHLSFR